MAAWVWVVIVLVAVLVVGVGAWAAGSQRRTKHLKARFGPEYERATRDADGRRRGEAELVAREERHDQLNIRPLAADARERYAERWQDVQAGFVDAPEEAVERADELVNQVMTDRGYPMDDFDQRAADISVEHPEVVKDYRAAHDVYVALKDGHASTEEERQAMRHYRSLFEELLMAGNGSARETERTGTRG